MKKKYQVSGFRYQGRNKQHGDTLIEVIFAFAILGTIIGFAFTGVIQARKSAIAAQERTQALEIAQYQTEALQGYRNSLYWNNTEGDPSFINGHGSVSGSSADISNPAGNFYCMQTAGNFWQLIQLNGSTNCNNLVDSLSNPSSNNKVQIVFSPATTNQPAACKSTDLNACTAVQAIVSINWTDVFGRQQNVQNIVFLTKQR